jgi:hypothetical protein
MKNKSLLVALLAIGLGLLIASCSKSPASCYELSKDYVSQLTQIASDFDTANNVAKNTDTMNLVTPISNLRDLMTKANNMAVPDCAKTTHTYFLNYMDNTISSYMAIWSNDIPDSKSHIIMADNNYHSWVAAFTVLQETPTP